MEHKAFLFDHTAFHERLAPLLHDALVTGDIDSLIRFIEENRLRLTDPCEGAPLTDDWVTLVEPRDAHQLGDFALTAFYDPKANIGLGYDWQRARDLVGEAAILGVPFGPASNRFDPGKLGAYFQSPRDVESGRRTVIEALDGKTDDSVIARAKRIFDEASRSSRGLFLTF